LNSHPPDDGFHEIQLNGKQLVFLFMAATVVSVVIFLCGVLVGRGVRAERGAAADAASLTDVPVADATTAGSAPAPAGSDPRVAAPPAAAVDDLTYFSRLEKSQPPTEQLKPPSPQAAARTTEVVEAAAPARQASTPPTSLTRQPPAPAAASARPPSPQTASARQADAAGKPGYVVQLAALNSRGEADAMAKRLASRGYEAYVQDPADGAPAIYRVRVGNYPTRREAETVAAKLEKEGQFKPWVAPR
jgi:cell division septation protein DedD